MLVDARPGADDGTILHHPLFEELAAKGKAVPDEFFTTAVPRSRAADRRRGRRRLSRSAEPAATITTAWPSDYDRRWLAAAAPVLPPIGAAKDSESGLVVLVQSDYQSVVRPARQLGEQFIRNSFWMFVVMVTVSLSLWYIVVRMFREPRAGLTRPATPIPDLAVPADMTPCRSG